MAKAYGIKKGGVITVVKGNIDNYQMTELRVFHDGHDRYQTKDGELVITVKDPKDLVDLGGRPSDYKPEFVEKAKEYLAECVDSPEVALGEKNGIVEPRLTGRTKVKLPTVQGLALYLHTSTSAIHAWSKEHEEFHEALNEILQKQHDKLAEGGLSGNYNSTIAKLLLSSNHGHRERSDLTSDDKPMTMNTLLTNLNDKDNKGESKG